MPRDINVQHALNSGYTSLQERGILAVICDWVEQNIGKIRRADALGVGWEGWAQAELALHINQRLGGQYATRKSAVYEPNAFADIVVWSGVNQAGNQTGNPVHIIELKCRKSIATDADFRAELKDDRFKLTQNAMAPLYKQARKWGIGINIGNLTGLDGNWHKEDALMAPLQVFYRTFV